MATKDVEEREHFWEDYRDFLRFGSEGRRERERKSDGCFLFGEIGRYLV
jgi:hypothetical protein